MTLIVPLSPSGVDRPLPPFTPADRPHESSPYPTRFIGLSTA